MGALAKEKHETYDRSLLLADTYYVLDVYFLKPKIGKMH